jgi:glycosyltransferase involved in cell wall biosynthesis
VVYRPSRISAEALRGWLYLFAKYPTALVKLAALALAVAREDPLEALTLVGNIHCIGSFARQLDRRGIMHVHAYFLSWPACIGLALATATGRTLSLAAHARDIFVEHGALRTKVARARFVTACTAVGLASVASMLEPEHRAKLYLNRHGAPLPLPSEPIAHPERCVPTFVAVGRLVRKKGFALAIQGIAALARLGVVARLVIIGDGPERQALLWCAQDQQVTEQVSFVGWQSNRQVMQYMRSAKAVIVPSVMDASGDADGTPNVILEAFALRVPVIASKLPGITEAVQHMCTGLLVEPGDVLQLAEAMRMLLRQPDLADTLTQNAADHAMAHYDLTRNTEGIAALLSEYCSGP